MANLFASDYKKRIRAIGGILNEELYPIRRKKASPWTT